MSIGTRCVRSIQSSYKYRCVTVSSSIDGCVPISLLYQSVRHCLSDGNCLVSSLVILHMNFYRCMCTRVYIHRGVHIRLFMTLRDVWLHIQASFPTCNDDYTVIATSSDKSFIVLVKYCKVIIVTPHPITPAGRCLHPPNGAIGVSKRLNGPRSSSAP